MRKSIIVIAGLFVMAEFGSTPPSVQAAVPMPFSTEFTQLLNYGQLLSVNLTAATQLANEIQQLQNSIRNLVRLPNQIFGPIQADINSLGRRRPGWLLAGLFDGESGRAVYKPVQRVRRIHAEQLLPELPDLVADFARYDSRHVAGGRDAGPAIAERTGRADLASNNGPNLGWRDGGAAGTRRDLRAGSSATHEAARTDAGRPSKQAGISGRSDPTAGERRSRGPAVLSVRRGHRRWR